MTSAQSWKNMRKFLQKESLVDVLRLIRSENVGPVTFFNLVNQFGSAKAALEAIPDLASRGGKRTPALYYTKQDAEREIDQVEKLGGRMLCFGDEDYPELLLTTYDPPPVLTMLGSPHLWKSKRTLAIVGSRNASATGYQFAKKLGSDAGSRSLTVVSGLARGIDTAAHTGSLASGTVAVMASGINHIYPPENKPLYEQMAKQGAIITEQPFGMAPHARSFPGRNRIISGMSLGTVIVEASLKSGSLITARFALEQGRDVFAVPGSPLDPRCKGTNGLIKQGAMVCESIDDVMQGLSAMPDMLREQGAPDFASEQQGNRPDDAELAEARKLVSAKLGYAPVCVDEILIQCQIKPNMLSLILLELELAGKLQRHSGHKVSLVPDIAAQAALEIA
ncbi:MAG TPA: DNA-processing protein DprA [Rickettsiales bacterium]|nr:DNA-processing protein DprA [Rickettsiales bacterium]